MVDNQSQNRLETLCAVIKAAAKVGREDRERQVGDIFNEMIAIQKNQQDSQTLQIIKEFYQRELSHLRNHDSNEEKLKEQLQKERQRRIEAESKAAKIFEEMKKQQSQMLRQEEMVQTLKSEFKRLKEEPPKIPPQFIKSISLGACEKGEQRQGHHQKNKSAAIVIPKLDLSKIKRDVDLNDDVDDDVDDDEIDQSEIAPDSNVQTEEGLKVHDYSDTEENLLNDLKGTQPA